MFKAEGYFFIVFYIYFTFTYIHIQNSFELTESELY